jgi:hypothetical protein
MQFRKGSGTVPRFLNLLTESDMNAHSFFASLWNDYVYYTPQAKKVHDLFSARGEAVINDHVAFRTFSDCPMDIAHLEPQLLAMGYEFIEDYHFEAKKLVAKSYRHADDTLPRIFLSELQRELLSSEAQSILQSMVDQVAVDVVADASVFWSGIQWQPIAFNDYTTLLNESEYAAWMSYMGLRANHFTVSINHLKTLTDIQAVLAVLTDEGFSINDVGGAIKGTPTELLEQASTMADKLQITFADYHVATIPTCFYEFAKRHPDATGTLFQGFVAANADKIFESTNAM